ncbi:hypothetical protein B296_00027185 [Ensete ventricosum]|uniref:Uncharacterized protein n=1 Tax=Ensete ventricosum TaxID=4639 RepID=A0A427AJ39_ENSVE|nr:hypothetical protein B296_00027185 [Ensete ventricosum]
MTSSMRSLNWKFSQVFGERQPGEKVEESESIVVLTYIFEWNYEKKRQKRKEDLKLRNCTKCLSLESVPPQGAEGCIPMLMTTTLILYQLIVTVICSDCETFLSADDLRINMWNLEVGNQCFNIIDLKPLDMEDLVVYKIVKLMDLDPFSRR